MPSQLISIERKISRLTKEIQEIEDFFYQSEQSASRYNYASMLQRKRDDVVRAAVLQLHTAIEDIVDGLIVRAVLGVTPTGRRKARGRKALSLRRVITGGGSIGFDAKLSLSVALGLFSSPTRDKLSELNGLRNKCSHNWLLNIPVRRGRRPAQKKPPLLSFRGDDLHKVAGFKRFASAYGVIYVRLWLKLNS